MRKRSRWLYGSMLLALGAFVGGAADVSVAADTQPTRVEVTPGMAYHEVITAWGAPIEKREHESRREDVWIYPELLVHFKEGRVSEVDYRNPALAPKKEPPEEAVLEEPLEPFEPQGDTAGKAVGVEDILGEIVDSGGAEVKPPAGVPAGAPAGAPPKRAGRR